tara:strand:+ start:1529 stop:1705 length:177 start_codon:yes stop_codon:yes gene_type:complete
MYRLWLVGCFLLSSLCAFQIQELDGDWRAMFEEGEDILDFSFEDQDLSAFTAPSVTAG